MRRAGTVYTAAVNAKAVVGIRLYAAPDLLGILHYLFVKTVSSAKAFHLRSPPLNG